MIKHLNINVVVIYYYEIHNNNYKKNISVNFVDNIYQTFNDTQLVKFDTKKVVAVYNLKTDSLLQNNIIGKLEQCKYLNIYTKAYLQTYVRCLKSNKMTVQNYFE